MIILRFFTFLTLPRLGKEEDHVLDLPGGWRFLPKPGVPTDRYAAVTLLTNSDPHVTGYCFYFGR